MSSFKAQRNTSFPGKHLEKAAAESRKSITMKYNFDKQKLTMEFAEPVATRNSITMKYNFDEQQITLEFDEQHEMAQPQDFSPALLPLGELPVSEDDDDLSSVSSDSSSVIGEYDWIDLMPDQQPMEINLPRKSTKEVYSADYLKNREMTPFQERMNAMTMVPGAAYCLYFIMSGFWASELAMKVQEENESHADVEDCLSMPWFPWIHVMPPLPVLAVAIATIGHAPFSFIYHWRYAHVLDLETRTGHWSRRMDQSMIHFMLALKSYATSGNVSFFMVNLIYNADCIVRQFEHKVQPRRNQLRILVSIIACILPILRRGELLLLTELCIVIGVSSWLFAKYPIGGWSHSAFHLVIALIPPLLMSAACELSASQEQLQAAVRCAVLSQQQ